MDSNSILSNLNLEETIIKDGIVYNENVAIGLIRPSLVEVFHENFGTIIGKEVIHINKNLCDLEKFKLLCNENVIVFGSSHEVVLSTHDFLKKPNFSRTSAYFLSFISTCDDFIKVFNSIEQSNVLIVGCGGIGSLTAVLLAGSGVKNITIIDGDHIEESNLNRQILWSRKDLGEKKVDVLYEIINARFIDINVKKHDSFLTEESLNNIASNYDLVIISADEPMGIGKKLASKNLTNVIICGYINTKLSFNFYSKKQIINSDNESYIFQRTPFFIGPSFGPSNIEISGLVSSFSIQLLGGILPQDNNSFMWDTLEFPRSSF